MVALDAESESKGTSGLMCVDNVDALAEQYIFGHWVIGHIVRKYDIGGDDHEGQIVCLNSIDVFDSVVVRRVAMCDDNDFSD